MKVTKSEFLVMLKYTDFSYISRLLRNGSIIADIDGLIDLENPQNIKWIKMRNTKLAKAPGEDNINKSYLLRYDLSLKAKGLMSLFLALPGDFEYSLENIMALCKENRWGVKSAIRELKNLGYLSVTTGRENNGYFNSIYEIYKNPKENPNFNKTN